MSTQRKPGSRGGLDPFARDRALNKPNPGAEPGNRDKPKTKGSTKTESPRKAFKRKPRK